LRRELWKLGNPPGVGIGTFSFSLISDGRRQVLNVGLAIGFIHCLQNSKQKIGIK
jgi:hypothetical protein